MEKGASGDYEVLWDDEFAKMLKPLHEKGIHIVVEMAQCYGGGFVDNLIFVYSFVLLLSTSVYLTIRGLFSYEKGQVS